MSPCPRTARTTPAFLHRGAPNFTTVCKMLLGQKQGFIKNTSKFNRALTLSLELSLQLPALKITAQQCKCQHQYSSYHLQKRTQEYKLKKAFFDRAKRGLISSNTIKNPQTASKVFVVGFFFFDVYKPSVRAHLSHFPLKSPQNTRFSTSDSKHSHLDSSQP